MIAVLVPRLQSDGMRLRCHRTNQAVDRATRIVYQLNGVGRVRELLSVILHDHRDPAIAAVGGVESDQYVPVGDELRTTISPTKISAV